MSPGRNLTNLSHLECTDACTEGTVLSITVQLSALGNVQNIHDLEEIQQYKISFSLMKAFITLIDEFSPRLWKQSIIPKAIWAS